MKTIENNKNEDDFIVKTQKQLYEAKCWKTWRSTQDKISNSNTLNFAFPFLFRRELIPPAYTRFRAYPLHQLSSNSLQNFPRSPQSIINRILSRGNMTRPHISLFYITNEHYYIKSNHISIKIKESQSIN